MTAKLRAAVRFTPQQRKSLAVAYLAEVFFALGLTLWFVWRNYHAGN